MSIRTMADRHRGSCVDSAFRGCGPARPAGSRPQLGSLLRDGVITAEQLQAALARRRPRAAWARSCSAYNIATGAAIARALAEQPGVRGAEPVRGRPRRDEPVARERRAAALGPPIGFDEDETVIVAVTDPDVMASDDLRLALGLQIRCVVASVTDLARTLDRCFRANVQVEMESDVLEEEEHELEDITEGDAADAPAIKLDEPDHRERDRRAPPTSTRAAAAGDGRPGPDRRCHAQGRRGPDRPHALPTSRLKIMGELDRRPPHRTGRACLDPL